MRQAQFGPTGRSAPLCGDYLHIMKGMVDLSRLHGYILKRYLLLLVGLSVMAFGVAFSIKASLGDVADLKRAVCCQSVYTFDGGDSDDRHALCFYRTSDTDPEEKLSSYPAHAAPGRIFLRISDGFRRVGGPRDLISCVLAAVGPLPDRYFSSGGGSKPGSESGRRSARRRGRSSCDLPGAPG